MSGGALNIRGACAACRVIWHWLNSPPQRDASCPDCGGPLGHVNRTTRGRHRDAQPGTRADAARPA